MKRSNIILNAMRSRNTVAAACALCVLAGCTTLNDWFAGDKVDYKSAKTGPTLSVPPDLSSSPINGHYAAPPNVATLGGLPQRATIASAGNTTEGVPSARDPYGMHLEQDGDRRWLVVEGRTPDQLWPQLKEFWQQNGFVLQNESSTTGTMDTDWAENRAKIPNDWFRRSVGKLFDFAYSSGTRDRFRTLVERSGNGGTDIFITHQGMEEMLTGREEDSSRWVDRPRDPNLEIAFLDKLMQKFGLTPAQSNQLIAAPRTAERPDQVVGAGTGSPMLELRDPFARAWLRVGLALDRTNFTVDRSDRDKGVYTVRYVNPSLDAQKAGLLGKLFNRDSAPQGGREYLVNVRANGASASQVAVLDVAGQDDRSSDARRIIALLQAQLR